MIGILFASTDEGRAFLDRYERGRFDEISEGEVLHDDTIAVSITGTGKVKATLRSERFLRSHRLERVIQAGLCIALKQDIAPGTVVGVDQVFEGDRIELAAPSYPRMPLEVLDPDLPAGTLVTQDHLVRSGDEQSYWQRIADYVDSTGYAVTYVAATHGIASSIIKVVSGHFGIEQPDIRAARARNADVLADYLIRRIERLSR